MYDQSFSVHTLVRVLRKSDFLKYPDLANHRKLQSVLESAALRAHSLFRNVNFLDRIPLGQKYLYQPVAAEDLLIVRKIRANLMHCFRSGTQNRDFIVSTLRHFLAEGVPYHVFRLDISNFYESFDSEEVVAKIAELRDLSNLTKRLISSVFSHYSDIGGQGIPRGLAVSATLAEIMMRSFDMFVSSRSEVFLYSRYVDDMILVTHNPTEHRTLIRSLGTHLPKGLRLHNEKRTICTAQLLSTLRSVRFKRIDFDYLGYNFLVFDPAKPAGGIRPQHMFRDVSVEIARQKMKKIKTRISRAFLAFAADSNFPLLVSRIRFLTCNVRIRDFNRNISKLSGIHRNYSLLGPDSTSLKALDYFLRVVLFSNQGRAFVAARARLSEQQKQILSRFSFLRGHRQRIYFHFSRPQLVKIKECWRYA